MKGVYVKSILSSIVKLSFLVPVLLMSCFEGNPVDDGTSGTITVMVGDENGCINKNPEYSWEGDPIMKLSIYDITDGNTLIWEIEDTAGVDGIDAPVSHLHVPLNTVQNVCKALELVKKEVEYKITITREDGTTGSKEFIATGGCGTGSGTFFVSVGDEAGCINRTPEYAWAGGEAKRLTVLDTTDDRTLWEVVADDTTEGFASTVVHGTAPADASVTDSTLVKLDKYSIVTVMVERVDGKKHQTTFYVKGSCNN